MQIEEYGEWTVVVYNDGTIEYLVGLHEVPLCKSYSQYYYGQTIAIINNATDIFIGCPRPLNKTRPYYQRTISNSNNLSNFLNEQLKIAKQNALEGINYENS